MLHVDPAQRLSADAYLERWRGTAFPAYFSSFLHPYLSSLGEMLPSPGDIFDSRIDKLYQDFALIAVQLGFLHEVEITPIARTFRVILRAPTHQRSRPSDRPRTRPPVSAPVLPTFSRARPSSRVRPLFSRARVRTSA